MHSFLSCFLRSSSSHFSLLTFSFITVFPSLFLAHSLHFFPPSLLPSLNFVFFHRLSFLLSSVSLYLITPRPSLHHCDNIPHTYGTKYLLLTSNCLLNMNSGCAKVQIFGKNPRKLKAHWMKEGIRSRMNSGNAFCHSIDNLSSSRSLSKNIKIKIHRPITF